MRTLLTLLLLSLLCTGVRAQLAITADLGLVADYCTGATPDPNVDCIPVPTGNSDLTYLPGQDGDLFFTYRLINNSGKIIRRVLATDSRFGTFFPTQTVNIPNGATVPLNIIYDALTSPENVNGVVTLTVQYADLTTEQVTGNYRLRVVAPMVDVEFGVARQADVCDNQPVAANCPVPYGALNGQTVTVGALDTFTTRFAWTNTGLSTFDMETVVDQDGFQIANTGFNQVPGQTLISSRHWVAPAAVGTYNYSQLLTITDMGGNVVTATVTYTVIVQAPMVSVEFGVARQADVCNNTIAPNCNVPYGALNGQTVTVGALDTFTTRFAWTNDGLGVFDMETVVDQDGFQIANTGFNQVPGQTLISSRHWAAPAAVGTYNYSQLLTVTDMGGNVVTATVTYTVIVQAPMVSVEFGVARQADVCNNTIAPNCNVPYGALNGQTVTVGALDTFTTRFAWTNDGLGVFDMETVVDQDGFEVANTGFNQVPGQTLISARHWEAPATPGTYNYSQTLTVTDFGGNTATATVTYTVIVQAPMVSVEFGVARQADVCDNTIAPNCGVPYGALNGQTVTVGALDTFTTRFAWTNDGLGVFDMETVVDQDGFQIANTGFNQVPGQTLISARHWEAPATPGTYNYSQTLTVTDFGGNTATATVTYIVIVEAPMVSIEFGVARQADVCDNTIAPNCGVPYGALNGQTVTVGALDTFTTRFAWTNDGLGVFDMETVVDQDGFQIANTGFNQVPGQTLISARHWEAPATPGSYNYSQTLTVTDFGGNTATLTVTYIVIVEAPMVEIEFGVANQNDVCPDQPVAPNCPVPYGPLNGQRVTVGAGDTLTTRFAWTNTGLGVFDMETVVDQDGFEVANTGFDQNPGQTLISSRHWVAPGTPDIYDWSQTLTITDKGGNVITRTVTFRVKVDCGISDLAPPVALCRDRTYTIVEGETQTINFGAINNGSFDGCGPLAGGSIDISSFTCADEGVNVVTLTVGDMNGNLATCTSIVTINIEELIFEGISNDCEASTSAVSGGQAWQDVLSQDGQLIAQVIIGTNTNIATVRAGVYKSAGMTEDVSGQKYLSKRVTLQMLNAAGNVVQPNNDPVYVRLYYTEAEMNALMAASPGSGPSTFAITKTSGSDCGSGYAGVNATEMNTSINSTGCTGENAYFEFFTGTFSTFYLFATNAILPVEMTRFEARTDDKQRVMLNWATATESGNSHFNVEHSVDGRTFRYLGAVAGAGDSSEEQRYEYLHATPASGQNYYRLRQVDLDGTETLSEVREVTISGLDQLSVFPNPAADRISLRGFTGGTVSVVDLQGRTLLRTNLPEFGSLNISGLPAGVYLLRAGRESIRWVKQ